jgi:hypothetical protein
MASSTTIRSAEEIGANHMGAQRIESGTPEGDALGFSEDLFSGWLEVRDDNRLYLHYIISRRRCEGNTQDLIRTWLSIGYDVRVVMPRPIMQHILRKFRFVASLEYLPRQYEDCIEVWYRPKIPDHPFLKRHEVKVAALS